MCGCWRAGGAAGAFVERTGGFCVAVGSAYGGGVRQCAWAVREGARGYLDAERVRPPHPCGVEPGVGGGRDVEGCALLAGIGDLDDVDLFASADVEGFAGAALADGDFLGGVFVDVS